MKIVAMVMAALLVDLARTEVTYEYSPPPKQLTIYGYDICQTYTANSTEVSKENITECVDFCKNQKGGGGTPLCVGPMCMCIILDYTNVTVTVHNGTISKNNGASTLNTQLTITTTFLLLAFAFHKGYFF